MLVRIESVTGLGLLHDARGVAHKLESRALIYAGNGRGKSTVASILRSCATGQINTLQERVTIDGTKDARVVLQFDAGHRVTFEQNSWTEQRQELVIYDSEFVERNVHSGTEITPEHRRNLLDFALGDQAVQAKAEEESASVKQQQATASIRQLSSQLEAHAGRTSLPVFRALKPVSDAKTKRAKIMDRLTAATHASSILLQPLPDLIGVPGVDIKGVFTILGRTLKDVHQDAEAAVDAHVASVGDPLVADWLRQGQRFDDHGTCPYCGQETHDVSLIQMYQSFFNTAYEELLASVNQATQAVDSFTNLTRWEEIRKQRSAINERSQRWVAYADVNLLDDSHDELAETSLENLRELLGGLVSRKALAITEAVGTEEDLNEALRLWEQFCQILVDANALVEDSRAKITDYKTSLESEDSAKIQSELTELDAAVTRHSQPVTELVENLIDGETELKDAEKEKKAARASLTAQMTQTLTKYRADINLHLTNLGALFAIDEIKTNFLGSTPRTDYGISLRGKPVKLTGGVPSFATALSEGDKRTMAFAFFVASTLRDPQLGNKIVVVDDPMSSLDKARREYTTELLLTIADRCSQLIILAHDAVYLRDLRKALERRDDQKPVSTMQISRTTNAYSDFATVDLDRECESAYYTNYRTVDDFVEGRTGDERAAAVAMRPLMEGYLHRRYPGHISSDVMLGTAIDQIDKALAGSPLFLAQEHVPTMRSLNSFAGKFHHDTNPDFATVRPDAQSVATYGKRVLDLIHGAS